jgi:integrase
MRVYKPAYTRPLPAGATKFTQRSGPNKGTRFAKYTDKRGRTRTERLTKDGKKILVETKLWHISFTDNLEVHREIKGFTDRQATQRLADNIQTLLNFKASRQPLSNELREWIEQLPLAIRDELIKFGLLDPEQAEIGKPLTEHIADYMDFLTKRERSRHYIKEVEGSLTRLFKECHFTTWTDISAARLREHLDGERDGGKGISKCRYNGLLGCVKSFCRWMIRQQRAASSPIEFMEGMDNQQTDQRHPRRALSINEFRRFLEAALNSSEKIYQLTGYERNLLYRFAAETGLRSIDIRRLRVRDFDFGNKKFLVRACNTKNKTDATVYLKPATATELKQYCQNKLPNAPVFYVTDKTALMVKFDLANTAIKDANGKEIEPAIPYKDEHKEVYDFHSLRHQTASMLAMNPNTPEAVRQKAMRHKTPAMTRHYSHAFEEQQREAIESMPDLTQPSRESQAVARTGTDDQNIIENSCDNLVSCVSKPTNSVSQPTEQPLNSDQKPQLHANSEGAVHTVDPKVEGSSPFGLVSLSYWLPSTCASKPFFFLLFGGRAQQMRNKITPDRLRRSLSCAVY